MVCCDECDRGYHSFCVGLKDIPSGGGQNDCMMLFHLGYQCVCSFFVIKSSYSSGAIRLVNMVDSHARVGLSNQFCPSIVVIIVCHNKFLKNVSNRRLKAITIAKQEVTIEIQKNIDGCVPDSNQNNSCLHMSNSFLFNIGEVRHVNTAKNQIRQRPGIYSLLTRVHTGVYVEKCPC